MKKPLAELIGTYLLVFLGTSAVVTALTLTGGKLQPQAVLAIGLTFGMSLVAIAYAFGPISGAHVNPAVTLGMVMAGKMPIGEAVGYWVAQFMGGILASVTVMAALGESAREFHFGANAPGSFGVGAAVAFEVVSTMLFFLVIYGAAASKRAAGGFAGISIGLYLAASHLAGIPISGSSLNPARDLGPAVVSGGEVLAGVWVYFAGPLAGAALGGLLARFVHEGD